MERHGGAGMRRWLAGLPAVAASMLAGLLFSPVFGAGTLLLPVAAAAGGALLADALLRTPRLSLLRPIGGVLFGALALGGAAAPGKGVAETLRTVRQAAQDGWLTALQTTWPVGAEPSVYLFVPLLVLGSAILGIELLRRTESGLLAFVPAVGVAVLAQAYAPVQGALAAYAALALATLAVATLLLRRPPGARRRSGRLWFALGALVPVALVAVPAALLASSATLLHRPATTLVTRYQPQSVPVHVVNPLHEIAARLSRPGQVAFTARTTSPVDRWTLATFTAYDGASWHSTDRYQLLGSRLPAITPVNVPTRRESAQIQLVNVPSPWLPTHSATESVTGASVLVDPASGTLVARRSQGTTPYVVTWVAPQVDAATLGTAQLDFQHGGDLPLGPLPAGLLGFAQQAVEGQTPSFRMALALESFFHDRYSLATKAPFPTGHSYAHLEHFLGTSRRGTSEQFASAYVVLARVLGIPARLAVGFRAPPATRPDGSTVVRNRQILAWPEVAVAGVGWVPLDPSRSPGDRRSAASSLANATDGARQDAVRTGEAIGPPDPSPAAPQPAEPPAPPPPDAAPVWPFVAVGLVVAWLAGVPAAKGVRRRFRRRRRGVSGAWLEVRDLLRDQGVRIGGAMTPRDLAQTYDGSNIYNGLKQLSACVDLARWSGQAVPDQVADDAWTAEFQVRAGLPGVRTTLNPASLLPRRG